MSDIFVFNKQAMSVMLSLLASSIYGVVDIYFISLLGTHELAAAGIISPFVWLFNTIASGFALAVSIFTTKYQNSSQFLKQILPPLFSGICFLCIIALSLYFIILHKIIESFSESLLTVKLAQTYFLSWVISYGATLLFFAGAAMMRVIDMYKQQTIIIIFSCILNIFLSPILMFHPIGLGISGAVYGTALSQLFAVVLFGYYITKNHSYSFGKHQIQIEMLIQKTLFLLRTALVTVTSSIFWPISVLISTYYIARLGDAEIAMMGIISKIQPLIMTPSFAISIAASVAISKSFQNRKILEIKKYFYMAVCLIIAWQSAFAIILLLGKDTFSIIISSYNTKAIELLSFFLWTIPITVAGRGMMFLLSQTLPALNKGRQSLFIDFAYIICLHTACYLVGFLFQDFLIVIILLSIFNIIGAVIFVVVMNKLRRDYAFIGYFRESAI
ncbi:MATE family efflux transporter [Pelistega sp. MC2]|uniref:MATE family efflux transporter n=1 Tax=Pelistega sp. MC2 TaxID=1720297 RepID=UPI0015A43F34|nr:MATE family efflux transporter [Pelistega sp. MC2]